MVRRPCGRGRNDTVKAQRAEIKLVYKDINHADLIILSHIVVQATRKQRLLSAIHALYKPTYGRPQA